MNIKIKINPEYAKLVPPLFLEDYQALKSSIKEGNGNVETLKISDETHRRLSKHGNIGDTFEDVIKKLFGLL